MPDPIGWVVLVVGALVGSLVGGVAGFGTGIIMLPLVAWSVGLRAVEHAHRFTTCHDKASLVYVTG